MSLSTNARAIVFALGLTASAPAGARNTGFQLLATPEYLRPDPFGGIVAADKSTSGESAPRKGRTAGFSNRLQVEGARGGYVSFHLVVNMPQAGPYNLSLSFDRGDGALQAEIFREWFHFTESDKQ